VETLAAIAHNRAVTPNEGTTNEGDKQTMHSTMKRTAFRAAAAVGMLALAVPAAAQFGGPPPPPNTGVPLAAKLVGPGSGHVTVVVDPPKGQLCYMFFSVAGLGAPTAASLNAGDRSVATLAAPKDGTASGCQPIAADAAQAIVANPAGYTVTVQVPGGVLSGQLAA